MKTLRLVRPSEHKKILQDMEIAEIKRKEEAEAAALAALGKKAPKAPAKKKADEGPHFEPIEIDMSEEPSVEMIAVIDEPEFTKVEGSDKNITLKTSCIIDHVNYECNITEIDFKPTLMYASRSFKFTIKNTSQIGLNFNFKIANS